MKLSPLPKVPDGAYVNKTALDLFTEVKVYNKRSGKSLILGLQWLLPGGKDFLDLFFGKHSRLFQLFLNG